MNIPTHDYIGGIEYQDNVLEAIYTDEGRAKPYGTTYRYEYTIKDHLGNSRVMFCDVNNDGLVDETEIIQEDHYYPFGMKHEGYGRTITQGENFYQFNGTEKVEDFDLAWHHTLFRSYDPTIGRWHQIDPKNSARESAYVGLGNNPILYSDMLGDTIRIGGSLDVGLEDMQSIVPESYKDKVSLNESGIVQFDITEEEANASGDIGVETLYHLVNSTYSYKWNVTTTVKYKHRETGEIITFELTDKGSFTSKIADRQKRKYRVVEYIQKVKKNGKEKKGERLEFYYEDDPKMPVNGNIDIERFFPASYRKNDLDFPRPSLVLHELLEMLYTMEEGRPYTNSLDSHDGSYKGTGAHNKAVNTMINRLEASDSRRGKSNGSIPNLENPGID